MANAERLVLVAVPKNGPIQPLYIYVLNLMKLCNVIVCLALIIDKYDSCLKMVLPFRFRLIHHSYIESPSKGAGKSVFHRNLTESN